MEKVKIRAVIKYLCKKRMPPRKSMKTSWIHLRSSHLLYLRGTGRALEMMSGLGGQKRPPTIKMPKLCTIWSCATEGGTCEALLGKKV
jgi:hypothetical protein